MVNEQLGWSGCPGRWAWGAALDGISSPGYGSEQVLIELLASFGLTAFTLMLPLTGVVPVRDGPGRAVLPRGRLGLYTRAGGSYVVARENFGPRVAQWPRWP